jgi:probable rRNA maturation factor
LVSRHEITDLNQLFLNHKGPTDVLTFDYSGPANPRGKARHTLNSPRLSRGSFSSGLHGEIIVCPEIAAVQAREFRTTLAQELVRYVIHGLLHLRGHTDKSPGPQRAMKREENRILRLLENRLSLSRLCVAETKWGRKAA